MHIHFFRVSKVANHILTNIKVHILIYFGVMNLLTRSVIIIGKDIS